MRRHLWTVGLLVAAVFAAYANALRNGFAWDDPIYIARNPFVQDPANLATLLDPRFYAGAHAVLMGSRPVVLATLVADHALYGLAAWGYHLTSVLLHAANAVWVYALGVALALAPPLPFWAALLFALHPVQTEAVDGISFRADLLAAFFVFAALWTFLKSRTRPRPAVIGWIAASAAFFGIGLLSKEMAATLPLLALLAEACFPEPKGRRLRVGAALAAYGLVACLYAGFWYQRFHYEGVSGGAARGWFDALGAAMPTAPGAPQLPLHVEAGHQAQSGNWEYAQAFADKRVLALSMAGAVATYARLLVLPLALTADRVPMIVMGWGGAAAPWGLFLAAAALAAAVFWRRSQPAAAFGLGWCLLALLPVLNIIPLYNPVAERYLYLVTAGFAWLAAAGLAVLSRQPRRRGAALAALVAISAAYGLRTAMRNADWRDDRALLLEARPGDTQSPRSDLARAGLLQGEGRLEEAEQMYVEALERSPGMGDGWLGLAQLREARNQTDRVAPAYERAMTVAPDNAAYPFFYAAFLARTGKTREAETFFRRALDLEPDFVEAMVHLGVLLRDDGRRSEARDLFARAERLAPAGNYRDAAKRGAQ